MKTLDVCSFFLSFFSLLALCKAKSGFILTSPKVIDAGSTEYFTLTLFDAPDNGIVTLSLKRKNTEDIIAQSSASALKKYNMWIEMAVPSILDSEAYLEIEGKFPGSPYQINQRKLVNIRHQSVITFVQTDKPVYKPGQIVKFRILPLDSLLKPLDGKTPAEIWMEDPAGVRIAQWKNVNFRSGIIQLELPLSEEPVLGVWYIKTFINNFSHSQQFTVEEYVLPKFEVIITPPSYIMADSLAIITEICAQYTYGKKVDGVMKAAMTYKKYPWEKDEKTKMPSIDHEGMISGCHQFLVKSHDLLLHKKKFGYRDIIVSAEVTENGTGITQNATTTVKITHTPLEMTFLGVEKGNRYFKPGLPFYDRVQVSKPDQRPAVDEKIEICAKLNGDSKVPKTVLCKNFTTDDQGGISFAIPAQSPHFLRINLEAIAVRYPEQLYESWGIKIHQPHTKVTLKPWYSPSGSHLQIEPITEEVQCEKLEQVKIYYTTNNGSTVNFYHQVISRGRIVQQGSHHRTFYFNGKNVAIPDDSSALQLVREEPQIPSSEFYAPDNDPDVPVLPHVGEFVLSFDSRATMSPIARLLVFYVQPNGEVVADSREFHITHCLLNKAQLTFRHEQQYPSTEAAILLSASPSSICGIGLVDKSVHLMHPDKQITKEKVFKLIEEYDVSASTMPIQTSEEYCNHTASRHIQFPEELEPHGHGFHYPYAYKTRHVDTITAFEDAGMVVMSNFVLESRPCQRRRLYYSPLPYNSEFSPEIAMKLSAVRDPLGPQGIFLPGRAKSSSSNNENSDPEMPQKSPKSVVEIRSYFPETWLWELHEVGENGETAFKRTLPDTVTQWVGNAICVHPETGLGISDNARITAFQPFFVSFTLPYSVIRAEIIPVIVTVFNYLTECLPIKLSLEPNEAFKIVRESRIHKLCICGGESKSHNFYIRPVALGYVNITVYGYSLEEDIICENEITARLSARDAVTRQLLVEAEGFPKEEISNIFICVHQSSGFFVDEIDLFLPENVVEGSGRAFASVTGDLLGPALHKLDELVRLPVGCGEQNMVLFAPNIFVLDYLTVTGRITDEIKTKSINYMKTGYQRELRYRHSDGSYSAFGERDDEGSMWLTAFVVRSFSQARRFISIDENDLALSTNWIIQKQFENGCFYPVGTVLHSGMKGGLGDGDQSLAPLTAYVLMALLEAGFTNDRVVSSATYCLRAEVNPSSYSLSLFAYATALAKDTVAQDYLNKLERRAIIEGNLKYWKYEKTNSKSIDIEISAYAILALLEVGGPNSVARVLPIVRWIAKQRNANGGFVSTQDTVVALQALAKYASFNTDSQVNVEVIIDSDQLFHDFKLNESNKLTMQSVKFPVVPTVVDFQVHGEGCALAQFILRYNVDSIPGSDAFDLTVATSRIGTSDCKEATIGICMRYKVLHQKSNMIVVTVRMISGYLPDEASLQKLQKDKQLGIKRHDVSGHMIHFYFYELTDEQKCFHFIVRRELEVENAQPGTVKLYDYYQTEWEVTENYEISSSCSETTILPAFPELPPLDLPTEAGAPLNTSGNFESEESTEDLETIITKIDSDTDKLTTVKGIPTEEETETHTAEYTYTSDLHNDSIVDANNIILMSTVSDILYSDGNNTDELVTSNRVISQFDNEDIALSDDEFQVQNEESHISLNKFEIVEHDLDTPDGLEGNVPVTLLPPEDFVQSSHNVTSLHPDCPICLTDFPENFTDIYCPAAFALRIVIRDTSARTVKIIHDVSSYLHQPISVKEFGMMSYDQQCNCPILKQRDSVAWLVGASADLWHVEMNKHNLILNSGVHVISASKKVIQPLQAKKAKTQCQIVP